MHSDPKLSKLVTTISHKDIRFLHKLGAGGFGTVRLAKLRTSDEVEGQSKAEASTQEDSDCSHDSPRTTDKSAVTEESKVS